MSNADLIITCRCGVGKPRFLLRWDIGNNEWRFTGDPSEFLAAHSGWEGDCKLMFYVDEEFRAATARPSGGAAE